VRIVLKLGGRVASGAVVHVRELAASGSEVVVVHGAGTQISAELARRGLTAEFVRGRRVTTPEALAVVRETLVAVGRGVTAALGPRAVQLVGDEIGLEARQIPELGFVGEPVPGRPRAVEEVLAAGRIPVVTPIAVGPVNVNADEAASALAAGLGAGRILFVTDVAGVLVDGAVVARIEAGEASRLLDDGAFDGGIVPKLLAAVRAARLGIRAEVGATEVLA
jgi:acetylglutamate kinase